MERYEYRILSDMDLRKHVGFFSLRSTPTVSVIAEELSALGEEGWELFATDQRSFLGTTHEMHYLLKRQVVE